MIPKRADSQKRLHVEGYKWGYPVEPLLAYLSSPKNGEPSGFDVLIMADVIYNYPEHANLVKTMQLTLKKTPEAVALVIFTPYEPWLLPQTEKFFPQAEEGGFTVTKIFQKMMGQVLFENDPGVSVRSPPSWNIDTDIVQDERLRKTVFGYELRWKPDQLENNASKTA
jgi:nicotinamide N-methyltransferase